MRNGLQDGKLCGQTLSNLQFLIQLELETLAAVEESTIEAAKARVLLRLLMCIEETLRDMRVATGLAGSTNGEAA